MAALTKESFGFFGSWMLEEEVEEERERGLASLTFSPPTLFLILYMVEER